jgi:hypothetical protein
MSKYGQTAQEYPSSTVELTLRLLTNRIIDALVGLSLTALTLIYKPLVFPNIAVPTLY